jgi:Mlc titration factor MtfA (ptsG expression regulator)
MLFSWLRARRRRAMVERPFPPAWDDLLRRHLRQLEWLAADERQRLRDRVAVFLAEKRFEGCGGMEIDDEVRVAVAAQAALAALGLPEEHFDSLRSVLVYPGDYVVPRSTSLGGGAELEWREARLGETWSGGSMVLSWPRVVDGGRMRDGPRNVVIHECAHLIDMADGDIDGVPPLPRGHAVAEWAAEMADCRERFEVALDEGRTTAFDDYAAESPAEFFAVASECFFQDPHRLLRHDRTLYELLAVAWRQEPRQRVPARGPRDR